MRLWAATSVLIAACVVAAPAARSDEPAKVHFLYEPGDSREVCPAEEELRRGVAARLGREPFDSRSPRTLRATIQERGRGLIAVIVVVDDSGTVAGTRELASEQGDCGELGRSMELAIAIAIDPVAAMDPPPPKPAAATPVPEKKRAPAPEISARPPAPRPLDRAAPPEPRAGAVAKAGVLVGAGSTPGAAPGLLAALGLGKGQMSLLVEGRLDWPASHGVRGASIGGTQLLGSLAACGRAGIWIGCGLGSVGALWARGRGFSENLSSTTPLLAVGARLGLRHRFADLANLEWFLDVRTPLTRTELTVDDMKAWSTAPVMGALGVATVWGGPAR